MGEKRHGRPTEDKKFRIWARRPKSLRSQDLRPLVCRFSRLAEEHPTGFEPASFGFVVKRRHWLPVEAKLATIDK